MFVVDVIVLYLIISAQVLALMVPYRLSTRKISYDRALIISSMVNFFGYKGMKIVI